MDTKGKRLVPTKHFLKTMIDKGFTAEAVRDTFEWEGSEVYPSGSHPGQWRIAGKGLCLVGVFEGDVFRGITLYLDRVVTPVRPDQMKTEEGRRFAQVGRKPGH